MEQVLAFIGGALVIVFLAFVYRKVTAPKSTGNGSSAPLPRKDYKDDK